MFHCQDFADSVPKSSLILTVHEIRRDCFVAISWKCEISSALPLQISNSSGILFTRLCYKFLNFLGLVIIDFIVLDCVLLSPSVALHSSKLSKRVDKQLAGRKALTRDMKTMVAEMELRHKMELEMFEYADLNARVYPASYSFVLVFLFQKRSSSRAGGRSCCRGQAIQRTACGYGCHSRNQV